MQFAGCWAKVARAKELVADVDAINQRISSLDNLNLKAHLEAAFDATTGEHILYISQVPRLEPLCWRVGVIVGDVVHNLRSALDHLVYELAVDYTQGAIRHPTKTQFPIAETPEEFVRQRSDRLSEVSRDDADLIETFQPYHRVAGRRDGWSGPYVHQLSLLHEMSNADKHRLLTTVIADPHQYQQPRGPGAIILHQALMARTVQPGFEVGHVVARAHISGLSLTSPQWAGFMCPSIGLEERRPAVPTMRRLVTFVELTINAFE